MKLCPTAEHRENFTIMGRISGLDAQKANPLVNSPKARATTTAVPHMKRFVQNMKSYGLGFTPAAAVSALRRFWKPAVTPSNTRLIMMYTTPKEEEALAPPFFLPMDTIAVPPMMAATCRY
eukprot:233153_1